MKRTEYDALMELISAKMDVMLSDAFGRDSFYETLKFNEIEEEFKAVFVIEERGDK